MPKKSGKAQAAATTVADVIAAMNAIAPPCLAVSGDPIGLHAGTPGQPVQKIVLYLDASLQALEEAVEMNADMLVIHHPRFYKGLTTVAANNPSGRRARSMVQSGLAVFSAHTNLDLTENGTNDVLAQLAGLQNPDPITIEKEEKLLKLAIFVPATHLEKVLKAVTGAGAGAGAIGKYSDCTFRTRGTGTFRCGADTSPYLGKPGSFEEVDEYRLETVCGEYSLHTVLSAMLTAHPYEEVAYDVYPMLGAAKRFGFGRVGDLAKAETVPALACRMAKATGSRMTQFNRTGNKVRRVAVWAGSGVDMDAVLASGTEALIAGEMGYHEVETLMDNGVAVITLGHGHSEEPVLRPLAAMMRKRLPGVEIRVGRTGLLAMHNFA